VNDFDSSTWQALGATLTVLGLLLSVLLWKRRGPASGLRGVAWSLLPLAAGLTGTLKLLWEIGDSIVNWAVRLVFSPVVWLGIAVAGVSLALFAVSAAMRARGAGQRGREFKDQAEALPRQRSSRKAEPAVRDEDMDDIEAILRKHGIS
jgi:heme exporter protein D